ncbi:uncharacterized protein LOC128725589 [Anopheles nili]|uniref:uncharacterized protein LOC128725589 n=1 Tax=Anopheles nili TaxID=185578 RepID=UPI00237C00BF|nr:uncharacterized protein LOC128725589 [Anopheles nili]
MDDFFTVRTYEQFKQDFPEWLIKVRSNPWELFSRQPGYIASQAYCVVGTVLCLVHALNRGGRWPYLWFASVLSGMLIETCFYLSPFGEVVWLSPTVIDLFGQRLPVFIFFMYPFFYYQAFWAVSKLQLKCRWSEHIAVGLLVALFDFPFEMVNINLLHWTLHETDQMLAERLYSVPWTVLPFLAGTTFAFSWLFHQLRKWFARSSSNRWDAGSPHVELLVAIGSAGLSVPIGSTLFLLLNYPLHTVLGIPNRVVIVGVFLCLIAVVWKFDRKSNRSMPAKKQSVLDHVLNGFIIGHFFLYLTMGVLLDPENAVSTGRHQPIGSCQDEDTRLCIDTVSKAKYDFHCTEKRPFEGAYWYTICGTPFENRTEVLFVLAVISFIAALIHWTVHYDFIKKIAPTEGTKKKGQ